MSVVVGVAVVLVVVVVGWTTETAFWHREAMRQ